MTSKRPTLAKGEDGTYAKYAWPGGYPVFYVTVDCGTLCPHCANTERSAAPDLDAGCPDDDQWRIVAADVNWEDPQLYCDHCGERIESAYAEDDAPQPERTKGDDDGLEYGDPRDYRDGKE